MATPELLARSVFVSRFNRTLAIVLWVLDAVLLAVQLAQGEPQRLFAIVPAAFVALFAWAALWHPGVEVDDRAVRLRNTLRTVEVPWEALINVDTRYALTLFVPGKKYSAWAAPAPGRTGVAMARRAEKHGRVDATPTVNGRVRPGDLLGSDSGQAAAIVREHWATLRDSGRIEAGIADQTPVHLRWHWLTDAALVALLVASGFAVTAL